MYLGILRFLGSALLGVMRFIERPARLAHVCCWLSAASQKTQDSYKEIARQLTATATTRIHFGLRPNVKRPSPVSRRELSIDVRAGARR